MFNGHSENAITWFFAGLLIIAAVAVYLARWWPADARAGLTPAASLLVLQ
jgi:hypothetical protein